MEGLSHSLKSLTQREKASEGPGNPLRGDEKNKREHVSVCEEPRFVFPLNSTNVLHSRELGDLTCIFAIGMLRSLEKPLFSFSRKCLVQGGQQESRIPPLPPRSLIFIHYFFWFLVTSNSPFVTPALHTFETDFTLEQWVYSPFMNCDQKPQ